MNAKIFNISEYLSQNSESQPIDRDELWQKLSEVPINLAEEYGEAMGIYLEHQALLLNIVKSAKNPHLVKTLVDALSEDLAGRLKVILGHLIQYEKQANAELEIQGIVNASLAIVPVTKSSQKKARELCELLKSTGSDRTKEVIAEDIEIFRLAANTTLCANIAGLEEELEERLAQFSEPVLNKILIVLKNYNEKCQAYV